MTRKCARPNCRNKGVRSSLGLCDKHYRATRHGYVPAGPSIAHYRRLRDRGLGVERISELTGLCVETLTGLGTWTPLARVEIGTADAILAIPVPDAVIDGGGTVPAAGTHRRIQALMLAGWSGNAIGAELGVTQQAVSSWMRRDRVSARTAFAVRQLCARWWMLPGGNEETARRSARKGWAPFLAWDDIDDPTAVPNRGEHVRVSAIQRVEELRSIGLTKPEIAAKLGIQEESLDRTISRAIAS